VRPNPPKPLSKQKFRKSLVTKPSLNSPLLIDRRSFLRIPVLWNFVSTTCSSTNNSTEESALKTTNSPKHRTPQNLPLIHRDTKPIVSVLERILRSLSKGVGRSDLLCLLYSIAYTFKSSFPTTPSSKTRGLKNKNCVYLYLSFIPSFIHPSIHSSIMEKEASTLFYSDSYSSYYHFGSIYSLWIWTTLLLLGLYTVVSLLSNASACYNFIVAWNLISRSHRVDLERIHLNANNCTSRRLQIDDALITKPYSEHANANTNMIDDDHSCCPICLTDFEPSDMVSSSCKHTCRHMFHNNCLSTWLQRDGTCPCCRLDMLLPAADPASLLYS
jgi:hypothetical protein